MDRTSRWAFGLTAALLLADASAAEPQDLKAKAREVLERYQDAVVNVKIALKLKSMRSGQQMQSQDQQLEVTGTIIDPSGLVVVAESETDPGAMMKAMSGGRLQGMDIESEVGEVKIILKDGKEIAGRLLMRDKDLDLAFIAPLERGLTFTHVALEKGKVPELFDDVLLLGRLGRNLDRAPAVTADRIRAIVNKPRTFYVCADTLTALTGGFGCPAFDATGKPIGLLVMRRGPAISANGSMSSAFSSMTPVVLPCEDIAEVAQQALAEAAKAPEKKPDEAPAGTAEPPML